MPARSIVKKEESNCIHNFYFVCLFPCSPPEKIRSMILRSKDKKIKTKSEVKAGSQTIRILCKT